MILSDRILSLIFIGSEDCIVIDGVANIPVGCSRITALFVELDMVFACKVVVAILFVNVVVFKTAV